MKKDEEITFQILMILMGIFFMRVVSGIIIDDISTIAITLVPIFYGVLLIIYERKMREYFSDIAKSLKSAYFVVLILLFFGLIQLNYVSWEGFLECLYLDNGFLNFLVEILIPSTFLMAILYAIERYLMQKKFNGCGNGGCHCKK